MHSRFPALAQYTCGCSIAVESRVVVCVCKTCRGKPPRRRCSALSAPNQPAQHRASRTRPGSPLEKASTKLGWGRAHRRTHTFSLRIRNVCILRNTTQKNYRKRPTIAKMWLTSVDWLRQMRSIHVWYWYWELAWGIFYSCWPQKRKQTFLVEKKQHIELAQRQVMFIIMLVHRLCDTVSQE